MKPKTYDFLEKDGTFVAFDTETSGAYPIGSEVVEFGAVKWKDGKIIDQLQFLLRPREPMSDFIIGIHGITNEMVADQPLMSEKISEIQKFFQGCILMGHHSAFDLGFLAYDFENHQVPFPEEPVLCTSLLAQRLITGVENHKLQTLVKALNIDGGSAHRAFDDAKACLMVGLECFQKVEAQASLQRFFDIQQKKYTWNRFSLAAIDSPYLQIIKAATLQKRIVKINYKKDDREVYPLGIVRSADGDYLSAICQRDNQRKRFYLNALTAAELVASNR